MRGKGSRGGEPCPKVRLSQDRMPIEPLSGSWYKVDLPICVYHLPPEVFTTALNPNE